jgi:hypothetical protein
MKREAYEARAEHTSAVELKDGLPFVTLHKHPKQEQN